MGFPVGPSGPRREEKPRPWGVEADPKVAHARDDNIVPHANAALYCNASRAVGVACEQLLLERGGHAFVVRPGPWRTCTTAAAAWLVRTVGARRKPGRGVS